MNHSISQDVFERRKDVKSALEEASARLAITVGQGEAEREAILWNTIGYYRWADSEPSLAERCFWRSLTLCKENSLKTGYLAALINLASLKLSSNHTFETTGDVLLKELNWYQKHRIGLSESELNKIIDALTKLKGKVNDKDFTKAIRSEFYQTDDHWEDLEEAPDWSLINHLLLLSKKSYSSTKEFLSLIEAEIEQLNKGGKAFTVQKVRLLELYGKLCFQTADMLTPSNVSELLYKYELEARTIWAFQSSIEKARKAGLTALEFNIRLNLSDYFGSLHAYEKSVDELLLAYSLAENSGSDDLLWRAQWRLGQAAMQAHSYGGNNNASNIIHHHLAEEWFDLAIDTWSNLPSSEEMHGTVPRSVLEAQLMFELDLTNSLNIGDKDLSFNLIQKLSNLPLTQAINAMVFPVKFERRKFLWGDGGGVIPYLRRELNQIRKQKASLLASAEPDSISIGEVAQNLLDTESDYLEILNNVTLEDPEFASLFSLPTFSQDSIQNVLTAGDMILQIIILSGKIHLMAVSPDTFDILVSDLDPDSVQNIGELFETIQHLAPSVERLYLILPQELSKRPFFDNLSLFDYNYPSIYLLPDIQSLVFLQSKHSLGHGENFSFVPEIEISGFINASVGDDVSLESIFDEAGTILIKPQPGIVPNPLDRIIFMFGDKSHQATDLFKLNTSADALIVIGDLPNESLLVRTAFYTGFSSVIFIPEDLPASSMITFLQNFQDAKELLSPGEAYYHALTELRHNGLIVNYLDDFKYYGSGGMNKQQRQQYARSNFISTVMKGNYNLQNRDGEWALRYYDIALSQASETGDSAAIKNLHNLRIQAARQVKKWEEAVNSQIALITIARNDRDVIAEETGLRNLSVYYRNSGDSELAINSLEQARQLALQRGDELKAAADYRTLASIFELDENYQGAIEAIENAGEIYLDWAEYESYLLSEIYLSRLFIGQENFTRASQVLEELLNFIQEHRDIFKEDFFIPAELYQHLGLAYEGSSEYDSALKMQLKTLSTCGDTLSSVTALSNQYVAGIYWKQGRYQESLESSRTARQQFAELELNRYVYLSENSEALVYMSLGDPERALEKAKSALAGSIREGDLKSRSQIEKNLGLIELSDGQAEKAIRRFRHSLEIDTESKSLRGQAYAHLNLGSAFHYSEQIDSSFAAFFRALNLSPLLSDHRIGARANLGLGMAYINRGNHQEAIVHLKTAREIADSRNMHELTWRIDLALAKAYIFEGKDDDALAALESAMSLIENTRTALTAEALQLDFMEDKSKVYQLAISLNLERGDIHQALNLAERSRSRSFLDLVQRRGINRRAGLDEDIVAEEAGLTASLSKFRKEVDWLKFKGDARTPEEDISLLMSEAKRDSLEIVYTRLIEFIDANRPGFKDIMTVSPAPPREIQTIIADDEALVEYYFLDDKLAIFILEADRIHAEVIPISLESINSMVSVLRERLEKKLVVDDECRRLYNILISPIDQYLNGTSSLIIVPAGPLHYLPFALLVDSHSAYFIDRFPLSYAPSANIFAFCRKLSAKRQMLDDGQIYALGNPDTDLPHENLFFGEKEVGTIGYTFKNTALFLGVDARESTLTSHAPQANLVHLACHGEYYAKNPMFSSLFLAPGDGFDGRLNLPEIFDLHLDRCALVMLSACESGLGGIAGGDEIVGFNRGFIYAGSPRVISSLWKVDDLATAILSKKFYRELKSGQTPAEALRHAQKHIRDRINTHPSYWAAFLLTGEPQGGLNKISLSN